MTSLGPLHDATRDLHHACERHPLGERMSRGAITPQEWCDWLASLAAIHERIDEAAPPRMARRWGLRADLAHLEAEFGVRPKRVETATGWAALLDSETDRLGACYVLHGAHRRGGRAMQPVIAAAGLPCWHLHYGDPKEAESFVVGLRSQGALAPAAVDTFGALLRVMDEVIA